MDDTWLRLRALVYVLPPLLFFMASVYLFLHVVFARLVRNPASPVLWFFQVVTGPLVRPVRAVLGPGTSEARARVVALLVYVALWLGTRILLAAWAPPAPR